MKTKVYIAFDQSNVLEVGINRAALAQKLDNEYGAEAADRIEISHGQEVDLGEMLQAMALNMELADGVLRYLTKEERVFVETALDDPDCNMENQVISKMMVATMVVIAQTREISKLYRQLLNERNVDESHHYDK